MSGTEDWREHRDSDGFPTPNEDRDGDLFTDGLGWCWRTLN